MILLKLVIQGLENCRRRCKKCYIHCCFFFSVEHINAVFTHNDRFLSNPPMCEQSGRTVPCKSAVLRILWALANKPLYPFMCVDCVTTACLLPVKHVIAQAVTMYPTQSQSKIVLIDTLYFIPLQWLVPQCAPAILRVFNIIIGLCRFVEGYLGVDKAIITVHIHCRHTIPALGTKQSLQVYYLSCTSL